MLWNLLYVLYIGIDLFQEKEVNGHDLQCADFVILCGKYRTQYVIDDKSYSQSLVTIFSRRKVFLSKRQKRQVMMHHLKKYKEIYGIIM